MPDTNWVGKITIDTRSASVNLGNLLKRLDSLKEAFNELAGAAKITIDTRSASTGLDNLHERLQSLKDLAESTKITVDIGNASASLDDLQQRLSSLKEILGKSTEATKTIKFEGLDNALMETF